VSEPFVPTGGASSRDPILDSLNPPQRAGVTHIDGPLLVVAGAGSGKTRLITHRIAHLLRGGAPPDSILAITFTNKAAAEMRERVESILGIKSPWISTFHSFAARILRRHLYRIPPHTSAFTIYDQEDVQGIIRDLLKEMGLDPKQWSPRAMAAAISAAKNRGARDASDLPPRAGYRDQVLHGVFLRYQRALEERNGVDFDDLLLLLVRLFETQPDLLARYRQQFRYVLIDEYQDTNLVQYRIGRLLTEESGNLCVTGDPDQSIYSWRGADHRNWKKFEADYPGARTVTLEQNYRSTRRILRTANALIRREPDRKPKDLWSENPEGEPVRLRRFLDGAEEAGSVAAAIKELERQGRRLGDIAVFYRINSLSRELEQAFRFAVLPYVLVGGVEFYQRLEVKDLVAYLRALANPRDSESFKRIINVPARRIGPATVESLQEIARQKKVPLLDVVTDPALRPDLGAAAGKALEKFAALIGELKALPRAPVADLLREALRLTEYRKHLQDTKGEEAEERLRNVEELVSAAAQFDEVRPEGGLEGFLEEVALLSAVDRWEKREDRVSLMSLHSAKGLEFPVVFIIGLESGLLPLTRTSPDPDDQDPPNISEERRLLYVGITRARERLTISHTRERMRFGRMVPSMPSDFLGELLDDDSRPGILLDEGTQDLMKGPDQETRFERDEDSEHSFGESFDDADGFDEDPFPRGARVLHPVFGKGTVTRTWGMGGRRRVTIRFDVGGEKQLALGMARLERIK
jgi:ATP-dependent DNA helicase UvrD/PcrA